MPTTYSAADVVGATLTAKQSVPLQAQPFDDAAVIRNVAPGQPVGVVYSYLEPGPGRTGLYWMFYDTNGQAYYARHNSGWYEVNGVYVPVEDDAGSWWDNILPGSGEGGQQLARYVLTGVAIWAGFKFLPGIINSIKS